jgi:hypothetical protein
LKKKKPEQQVLTQISLSARNNSGRGVAEIVYRFIAETNKHQNSITTAVANNMKKNGVGIAGNGVGYRRCRIYWARRNERTS